MKTLITLLFAIITVSACGQNSSFLYHQIYRSDNQIQNVSSGDLNGDENVDLVIAESMNNNVLWFRNDGAGNFARDTIGTFSLTTSVTICDPDNDSDNDVLVASSVNSEIALFENDGTGRFTKNPISEVIDHPNAFAIGDIDDDGDYDIACAAQGTGAGVVLFINQGNCNYTSEILSSTMVNCTCIEISDIDNDGDMDIISNEYAANGGILVYKQINQQTFEEFFINFPWANSISVSDINGDGLSDILSTSCGSQVAVFFNLNSNFFQKSTLSYDFPCGVSAIASNFAGDTNIDIAAASWGGSIIGYWENNNSTFFAYQNINESIINPSYMIYNDLNNDSKKDIICTSSTGFLVWLENQSSNSISQNNGSEPDFWINYSTEDKRLNINSGTLAGITNIRIINTLGQVVVDENMNSQEMSFDCLELPSGTYIISLESEHNNYNQKLII